MASDGHCCSRPPQRFPRRRIHPCQSLAWYWYQVMQGILSALCQRSTPPLAARHARHLHHLDRKLPFDPLRPMLLLEFFGHNSGAPELSWATCFLGGAASGFLVSFLHPRHRNMMLLSSAAARLVWSVLATLFLKRLAPTLRPGDHSRRPGLLPDRLHRLRRWRILRPSPGDSSQFPLHS